MIHRNRKLTLCCRARESRSVCAQVCTCFEYNHTPLTWRTDLAVWASRSSRMVAWTLYRSSRDLHWTVSKSVTGAWHVTSSRQQGGVLSKRRQPPGRAERQLRWDTSLQLVTRHSHDAMGAPQSRCSPTWDTQKSRELASGGVAGWGAPVTGVWL